MDDLGDNGYLCNGNLSFTALVVNNFLRHYSLHLLFLKDL